MSPVLMLNGSTSSLVTPHAPLSVPSRQIQPADGRIVRRSAAPISASRTRSHPPPLAAAQREPRVGSPRPAPTAPASRRDTLLAAAAAALLGPGTAAEARGEGGGSASPAFQVSAEGLRTLKLRDGGTGITPAIGDEVEINFTGRLASKQGWYFENTYQHKGPVGFPLPYRFTVGDGSVIEGLDLAVQRMSKGDILRAVIPPALSYQSTAQGPVPQEWSNRRRLYSTIFNEVRMANGEGATLATVVLDIELMSVRRPARG
mmetsp:Transcript_18464/g.46360  ORF Transcript_18464/g.46360 Transcript_18464/m.46360 type:complete len:260 (+) Transcript_18464:58-837(+)